MKLENPKIPDRIVYCEDAIKYLKAMPDYSLPSTITSLPDAEEVGMNFEDWEDWFISSCQLILRKVARDQFVFFYQTDRKREGGIINKSFLVNLAAQKQYIKPIFHKIVLKRDIGVVSLFRPGYTHLLCFSHKLKIGKATPDVIECGEMLYKNAMGMNAAKVCLDMVGDRSDTIFDPFCGMGSVLRISNKYGKKAIGVDISIDQCRHSLELPEIQFSLD